MSVSPYVGLAMTVGAVIAIVAWCWFQIRRTDRIASQTETALKPAGER